MEIRRPSSSDERGYTLVELLVAAFVLVVGMAGAFALLNGANRTTTTNNARMGATNLARELLEDARSVDYDTLTPTRHHRRAAGQGAASRARPRRGSSSRRGIEYTVTADVCTFDDPKDNVAATPPANVCTPQAPVPASAGTLEPEIQPDDFRRVTVTLAWNTRQRRQDAQAGLADQQPLGRPRPAHHQFDPPRTPRQRHPADDGRPPRRSRRRRRRPAPCAGTATARPTAPATRPAARRRWTTTLAARHRRPPASPARHRRTGPRPSTTPRRPCSTAPTPSTAQAFNDLGIAGDSRAAVLPLNRSLPITVTGFEAGRNFNLSKVEFQLEPEPRARHHRLRGLRHRARQRARQRQRHARVPDGQRGRHELHGRDARRATPTYYVVALDRTDITDTGERGAPSRSTRSRSARRSTEPDRPTLAARHARTSRRGKPKLSWTHPNTGGGPLLPHLPRRLLLAGRPLRPDGDATRPRTSTRPRRPALHRYWVTAVGPGISESQPSNSFDWLVP